MKKIMVYVSSIAIIAIFFTAGYYLSYQRLKSDYEMNDTNDRAESGYLSSVRKITGINEESETVSVADNTTVKPTTKFVLETINKDDNTVIQEICNPTSDFIGLTRQEIIDYLTSYMKNLPLVEYEKGLCSYELTSFSAKEFHITKVYDKSLIPYKFFITLKDNYVIIYYSDLKTIYDYTKINGNSIDYEEKYKLMEGFYVKDSEELFAILEGYTS